MDLILVESPTKAKTFLKYLDKGKYTIEATMGHIRDLPENTLGITIEDNFKPNYEVLKKKADIVKKIVKLAKNAHNIIFATDSDREGEAISYHIAYLLGYMKEDGLEFSIKKPIQRILFHEITKTAIHDALLNPKNLNLDLVNAQQARRLLDRIVGYKLSPLLWRKMGKRWLSAGRVQTVALRFIVEREKEIKKFESTSFFTIKGLFSSSTLPQFEAKLVSKNAISFYKTTKINLFDGNYSYSYSTINASENNKITLDLKADTYKINSVNVKSYIQSPKPPYTTSTLQQDCARLFGYSSKLTMSIAQSLYENGLITYHRTDSLNITPEFIKQAKQYVSKNFKKEYLSTKLRFYKTKSKIAQEAHEAIRPTHITKKSDDLTLSTKHKKVYELIWNRSIAIVMSDAKFSSVSVSILSNKKYEFQSLFEKVDFDGWLILLKKPKTSLFFIPSVGDSIKLDSINSEEKQTNPPPRYTEGTLIKTLEARGIGRPSTYAPTISTLLTRQYVEKLEGKFHPTIVGITVCDYLSNQFKDVLDIEFTARLEDDLDAIAQGKEKTITMLTNFYKPFEKLLNKEFKTKKFIDIEEKTEEKCPECKKILVIRYSKFGKFYACSGYPDCKYKKSFTENVDKKCPKCGSTIIVRFTKNRKRFYGCSSYPKCKFAVWRLNQI